MLIAARQSFLGGKRLPPGVVPVEYLESTGTQWIEIPVRSDAAGLVIETRLFYDRFRAAYQSFFGARRDEESNCVRLILQASANGLCWVTPGGRTGASTSFNFAAGVWHDVRFVCDAITATIDGTTQIQSRRGNAYGAPMRLFGLGGAAVSTAQAGTRIAHFKAWTGGTEAIDLIPVRVGSVGYMYDRVSGQLFGNEGTGAFIVGPDVEP